MDSCRLIDLFPEGVVDIPPSKSFGHRALICAALAALGPEKGESLVINSGTSDDIKVTREALKRFGLDIISQGADLLVRPGQPGLIGTEPVDCGESGSTLRFLVPLAAMISDGPVSFTGRGRLMERPLAPFASIFAVSGATFHQNSDRVTVTGPLGGQSYQLPGNISSQFVSGLLMALPLSGQDSRLTLTEALESAPYVDITLAVMRDFGVTVERPDPKTFIIPGGQVYRPAQYQLEADYSQAAFFLAAAALGRPVKCRGLKLDSCQGDRAILTILEQMGAEIVVEGDTVTAKAKGKLKGATIDMREIPDLGPVLSSLTALAEGESRLINAGRLRIKESDRLSSMAAELAKLGAKVNEGPDSLTIFGQPHLPGGAVVEAHNDHRVAMALAVAAIGCRGPVRLMGGEAVAKSYPHFWQDFGKSV